VRVPRVLGVPEARSDDEAELAQLDRQVAVEAEVVAERRDFVHEIRAVEPREVRSDGLVAALRVLVPGFLLARRKLFVSQCRQSHGLSIVSFT
jgi:hypothetical protein